MIPPALYNKTKITNNTITSNTGNGIKITGNQSIISGNIVDILNGISLEIHTNTDKCIVTTNNFGDTTYVNYIDNGTNTIQSNNILTSKTVHNK